MDAKNVHIAKLIPGQQKNVRIMAPNPKGCRALAMPQRQQSEYPVFQHRVFQHREIHVHRIILRDQHVRPVPT